MLPNIFSQVFYKYNRLPNCAGPGSVVGIATGYGLDGPGIESRWGVRFSAPVQTGPVFPGVKSGQEVTMTPYPLLVLWSRKSRVMPLPPPPWAIWPVQSLSACTRVHFTLPFLIVPTV